MAMSPNEIIMDLESYIELYDMSLSKEARKVLYDIEEFSYKCNYPCRYPLFFSKAIRNCKEFQRFIYSRGINPKLSAIQLEMAYYDNLSTDTNYQRGTVLYSCIHEREWHQNTAILDEAMLVCVRDERAVLEIRDIVLAAINVFEKSLKQDEQQALYGSNDDKQIMLFEVCGKYYDSLYISFEDIKNNFLISSAGSKRFMLPGHIFR